jgi:hypothetical protein
MPAPARFAAAPRRRSGPEPAAGLGLRSSWPASAALKAVVGWTPVSSLEFSEAGRQQSSHCGEGQAEQLGDIVDGVIAALHQGDRGALLPSCLAQPGHPFQRRPRLGSVRLQPAPDAVQIRQPGEFAAQAPCRDHDGTGGTCASPRHNLDDHGLRTSRICPGRAGHMEQCRAMAVTDRGDRPDVTADGRLQQSV